MSASSKPGRSPDGFQIRGSSPSNLRRSGPDRRHLHSLFSCTLTSGKSEIDGHCLQYDT
jgi:hypothetical protein